MNEQEYLDYPENWQDLLDADSDYQEWSETIEQQNRQQEDEDANRKTNH